jgi:hypothetical protein
LFKLLITTILSGFFVHTFAQAYQSASATATIVTPINLMKVSDLDFGNISVNAVPGTVILNPDGTRNAAGGVTLPSASGNVSPSQFNVMGMQGYTYSITLPSAVMINNTFGSGNETMIVDNFVSDPPVSGNLGSTGTQTLNIGATVHVSANQAKGTYISPSPFYVSVNYN